MRIDFDDIFPEGMTDESAWAISKALYLIAEYFEVAYLGQIMRESRRMDPYEVHPERPWERLK